MGISTINHRIQAILGAPSCPIIIPFFSSQCFETGRPPAGIKPILKEHMRRSIKLRPANVSGRSWKLEENHRF